MPSIANVVDRFTKQYMLYWAKLDDLNNEEGKPVFAEPVTIKVRWEDKIKQIVLPDGRMVIASGYLLLTSPVVIGSIVFLGTRSPRTAANAILDWKATSSFPGVPTFADGGREILMSGGTPDIKAIDSVYEAYI